MNQMLPRRTILLANPMLTQDGSVPFIPGSSRMRIVLAAVAFLGAMLAVESAYSQFVQTLVPALPGVFSGSVAWGDYDNDTAGRSSCAGMRPRLENNADQAGKARSRSRGEAGGRELIRVEGKQGTPCESDSASDHIGKFEKPHTP